MRVSANIASLPNRIEQLKKTVASLIYQVDEINICLNNYEFNPFDGVDKVNIVFSNNALGDAGKFLFLDTFEGYYFTCDDDLIYPPTYIEDTIKEVDKYGVVSYHGRTFLKFPIESYYKSPAIRNRCLAEYKYTEPVDIGGTGVMCIDTTKFKPSFGIFKRANMSDIWISCEAKKRGIKIWGLKHNKGYFTYQQVPTTIYDDKVNDCEAETKIVNDYFFITK